MSFDWNDIRYFLAVARNGTISEAARRLRVNHATVIRRIDALENALSTKLFERTPKGYGLTQSGERMLEASGRIEAEADKVGSEVGGRHDVSGTVRISSLEGFGSFFLARHLPEFAKKYPRLKVELITIQQIIALSKKEADIIVTVNPPEIKRYECEKLIDYSLCIYGTQQYLSESPAISEKQDLLQHRFSGYIDELVFTRGLDYLGEIIPGLRPSLQSSSLLAQLQFACAGHGLCVLPAFIASTQPDLVPVLPDTVKLSRTYWLTKPPPAEATPSVRLASRFIEECVREQYSTFQ